MKCDYIDEGRELPDQWPAFPRGFLDDAIQLLSEFPDETHFYEIVSQGRCSLFTADRLPPHGLFPPNFHYVAIWHEHLQKGLERNFLRDILIKNGELLCAAGYFRLTPKGHRFALISHLTFEKSIWPLFGAVEEFLLEGKYGTAVREATVRLEHRIRHVSGAAAKVHGEKLLREMISKAPAVQKFSDKSLQLIEARYRRFFSFVRNEFAHKLSNPDLATAINLIARCAGLYNTLDTSLGYPHDEDLSKQVYENST